MFYLNRYYILFATVFNTYGLFTPLLSDSFCRRFLYWQGYTGLVACLFAEVILQMRIYALYLLNKKVLTFTVITCVLAMSSSAVIMARTLSRTQVFSNLIPGEPFCVPLGISPDFYSFWIPILVSETLLFGLALTRGVLSLRTGDSMVINHPGGRLTGSRRSFRWNYSLKTGRTLIAMMVRDSVLYFFAMFAVYLTSLLIWIIGRVINSVLKFAFSVAHFQ
jgi:hypothetical protein